MNPHNVNLIGLTLLMAAMAYDENPILKKESGTQNDLSDVFYGSDTHKTPDTDPDQTIRNTYGLTKKFFSGPMPIMFNFGLPKDYALGLWTANNLYFKSDQSNSYYYQDILQPPYLTYKLYQQFSRRPRRNVTSIPEAMGYVTKSLTRTVGADLRTQGAITDYQNMSNWGPGANHAGFGDAHSAQWSWNNQSTHLFWKRMFEVLNLATSN